MAVCNWDPNKHGGKPCPIHGNGAVEGREERKKRRQELKQNEDSFRDNKYSYSTARKVEDEINEKYGRKSSEKYNIGSNKKLQGEERQKMQDLVDAFNEIGVKAELKDGWEDYGAKMEWTAPVADGTWLLYPNEWIKYMNGKESIQDIIEDYAEKHNIDIDEDTFKANMFDTEEEYKNYIEPKIKEEYDMMKKKGLSEQRIRDELMDGYGYKDLVDKIMNSDKESFDDDYEEEFEEDDTNKPLESEKVGNATLYHGSLEQIAKKFNLDINDLKEYVDKPMSRIRTNKNGSYTWIEI